MKNYTNEDFLNATKNQLLSHKCNFCQREFFRRKVKIQIFAKRNQLDIYDFCSRNCKNESLKPKKTDYYCEKCKKFVSVEKWFGTGRFCSIECSNSKYHSEKTKLKISKSIRSYIKNHPYKKFSAVKICKNCGFEFNVDSSSKNNLTCRRSSCRKYSTLKSSRLGGQNSARLQAKNRRSKNEIAFFELCKSYYKNVDSNKAIFNNWDADILIYDYKLAILWNGPWHYKKITEKHSVKQVQNRDKIKIKEIEKLQWIPYIIKDLSNTEKERAEILEKEFRNLIEKYPVESAIEQMKVS